MKICNECLEKCYDANIKDGDKCPLPNCTGIISDVPTRFEDLFIALFKKRIPFHRIYIRDFMIHIEIDNVQIMEFLVDIPDLISVTKRRYSIEITRQIKKCKNQKDQDEEEIIAVKSLTNWIESLSELKVLNSNFGFLTRKRANDLDHYLIHNEICFHSSVHLLQKHDKFYILNASRYIKADNKNSEEYKLRKLGKNMGAYGVAIG